MSEKEEKHLRNLLKIDFDKWIKLKISGYCKVVYNIAVSNGLGADYIQKLKEKYSKCFNMEI